MSRLIAGVTALLLLCLSLASAQQKQQQVQIVAVHDHSQDVVYNEGDEVKIQCLNHKTQTWGPGPICAETKAEMKFNFGVETFQYCGWTVATPDEYNRLSKLINREENWECRVSMDPSNKWYLPFSIPVWGVVEGTHIHIDNHLNFVFHADQGRIIGVTAYPVRDRFQFVTVGTVVSMHGPTRWMKEHSFVSMTSSAAADSSSGGSSDGTITAFTLFTYCTLCTTATFMVSLLLYRFYWRPKLLQEFIKSTKKD